MPRAEAMRVAAQSNASNQPNGPKLAEFLSRAEEGFAGLRAIHVPLSRMRPNSRRKALQRRVGMVLQPHMDKHQGAVFAIDGGDKVYVFKDADPATLDGAVTTLAKAIFEDDSETGGPALAAYDLSTERAALADAVGLNTDDQPPAAEKAAQPRPISAPVAAGAPARRRAPPSNVPLAPDRLSTIEAALAGADLTSVMRRQTVCMLIEGEQPKPVFRELYVSIADLENKVAPGVKLAADRWLFQHLTRVLDQRMLAIVAQRKDPTLARHISLNLNVSSVLSPEFLAFDAALDPAARETIVLELQLVDILADMGAFAFAREFAKERGYSLCLDGLTYQTAPLVDRNLLGIDLVKVIWSDEMASDSNEARRNAFAWMVDKTGDGRAILCRCDGEDAIGFGQESGITLFQGIAVDSRIAAAGATAAP